MHRTDLDAKTSGLGRTALLYGICSRLTATPRSREGISQRIVACVNMSEVVTCNMLVADQVHPAQPAACTILAAHILLA